MSDKKKERELAKNVFGESGFSFKGNVTLDYEELTKPFDKDWIVIRCFCRNCGILYDFDEDAVEVFLRDTDILLPDEMTIEHYLEFTGCFLCFGRPEPGEAYIKLKHMSRP